MNIFTLMGTILVDNTAANNSISSTGQQAEGLAGKFGGMLANAAKVAAGAIIAVGTAAAGMAVKAVSASDECQKALNTLQVQTGATSEEMGALKESMLSIYSGNYGESFEDVASALANVKQQTGLAGKELESFTTNAIVLRDTFEYEVNESTRSAKMLMDQFGISGEEAFNLIAQGAQQGLDKNGDLLDTINEYSVHFEQLGFDAEGMFNALYNGANAGTFSVDKLGDAMKEFGIRSKVIDDSGEAFEQLGFNAEEMVSKFNVGGEEASQAFKKVNKALFECKDATLQNTLGVQLYGTMWEDLGVEGVKALTEIGDNFNQALDTMEQIDSIKYDSFSEAITGIGRQIEANVLVPLGDSMMPLLNEFANWLNEHIPEIQTIIEVAVEIVSAAITNIVDSFNTYLMPILDSLYQFIIANWPIIQSIFSTVFGVISTVVKTLVEHLNVLLPILAGVAAGFAAFKVITTVSSLFTTLSGIVATVTAAISAAGGVTAALGAAIGAIASPIVIAVAAIGSLVAAFVYLYNNNEQVREALNRCWEDIKVLISNAIQGIEAAINSFIAVFNQVWTKYGEDIKEIAQAAWNYIGTIVQGAINLITNIFNIFSAAFQGDWGACWEAVQKLASDLWNDITAALKAWLDLLVVSIVNIGHAMMEAGKGIFTKLWDGIKNVWQNLKSWLEQVKQDPVKTITSIGSAMFNAGKQIFTSMWDGIKNVWSGIQSWVSDKVNWIKDKVTFWNNSNSSMDKSKVNGSHAGGINEVPYDGYLAELHKGERVLTASENNTLNAQNNDVQGKQPIIINMYYPQVADKQSIKTTSRQLRQQITQGDRALGLA